MVIIKSEIFKSQKKNKYLLTLMLFLEVNKNYIGKVLFNINLFLAMFDIKSESRNIKLVKEALEILIDLDIITVKNLLTKEKISSFSNVIPSTPLFITILYDSREFRKYDDEFIFHVLDLLGDSVKFTTTIEIYLFIISRMFSDELSGLSPAHVSYANIIENTSVGSNGTVSSHLEILEEKGLLKIEKEKSKNSGHTYNTYSIPKELRVR